MDENADKPGCNCNMMLAEIVWNAMRTGIIAYNEVHPDDSQDPGPEWNNIPLPVQLEMMSTLDGAYSVHTVMLNMIRVRIAEMN